MNCKVNQLFNPHNLYVQNLNYQVAKIYQFALQESTTIFTVKGSTMDRFVQVYGDRNNVIPKEKIIEKNALL